MAAGFYDLGDETEERVQGRKEANPIEERNRNQKEVESQIEVRSQKEAKSQTEGKSQKEAKSQTEGKSQKEAISQREAKSQKEAKRHSVSCYDLFF